jgi:PBP1b-binding outer membrane lipoprotein LpoB
MKTIITYFGIVLLLVSCNQGVDSTKESDNQETEENSSTDLNQDYEATLNTVKTEYQKKLDTGVQMLKTTKDYNKMVDSLMTLAYTAVLYRTIEDEKTVLIEEHQDWLEVKEKAFNFEYAKGEKIYKETGIFPEIEEMVAFGTSADLNYERAVSLAKKFRSME